MSSYKWQEDSEYIIPPENIERLRKAADNLEVDKKEPFNDDYLTIFAFRGLLGRAVKTNKKLYLTMEFLLRLEEEISELEKTAEYLDSIETEK